MMGRGRRAALEPLAGVGLARRWWEDLRSTAAGRRLRAALLTATSYDRLSQLGSHPVRARPVMPGVGRVALRR